MTGPSTANSLADFVLGEAPLELPKPVRRRLAWLIVDLGAVMVGGRLADCAEIAAAHASRVFGGADAQLVLDGRRASAPGAAWANGVLANALDFDDGHREVKGHPGAVVIPAVLAAGEQAGAPPEAMFAAAVVGYEVAIRVGVHLHRTAATYHGSGAWGAVGAAAAAARLAGLDAGCLRHALGLAEYHAPMTPILRSTSDPAMTKDGIGWGAMVGVASVLQAADGFTAASSRAESVLEGSDVGESWRIPECYVKPHPSCRWGHPAVLAALRLREEHDVEPSTLENVVIHGFAAAGQLPRRPEPRTTEEAQYSLVWPVACALVHGACDIAHVTGLGLQDAAVRELAARVRFQVDPHLEARFPTERRSAVSVRTAAKQLSSAPVEAAGEPDDPGWEQIPRRKHEVLWPQRGAVPDALEALVCYALDILEHGA